jgi:hypothetical protein
VDAKARAASGKLNTRIIQIDPRKIRLLEVNARYMRHETYARLRENVQADGVLTQIPFGWRMHDDATQQPITDDAGDYIYQVLSGNHRVKSAVDAGLPLIDFQVTDDYLPPDRRKAIQISHNAIAGEDDPAVLKLLYDGITEVGMKLYTGLDDKTLNLLDQVSAAGLSEANLQFQTVSLVFLPEELEAVEAAWAAAKKLITGSKAAWLARFSEYDKALDAIEAASMSAGVKNTATALLIVLEIFSRHMTDLSVQFLDEETGDATDKKRRVPLTTVFGDGGIPADLAAKLTRRVQKMKRGGKLTSEWELLSLLADE